MRSNFLNAYVCVICGSNSITVTKDMGQKYRCGCCGTEYMSAKINDKLVMNILTEYKDVAHEISRRRGVS